ncbi:MAG TPA: hypothetical protein VHK69_02400, partial [Chitinophagaceae bacterium]|nr:hypothetical protein [Chitinophagaceae bacterium]
MAAQKDTEGLLDAEKRFAALARDSGTRTAFLRFADSTAVIWEKNSFQPVHRVWRARPESPSLLGWHPVRAVLSASGDFGYTTGPWTFRPGGAADTIAAQGYFVTVWRYTEADGWKFLIDLGIGHPQAGPARSLTEEARRLSIGEQPAGGSLEDTEASFQDGLRRTGLTAYLQGVACSGWLYRDGYEPFYSRGPIIRHISASFPIRPSYSPPAYLSAPGGDIGVAFGTARHEDKQAGYLRIWIKEGGIWTLALSVLP